MKLSIIVPAFNEERRLKSMLERYAAYFVPRYGDGVELLVVVNGSIDETEAIARDFARNCPSVKVIVEPRPVGKGGAIMLGFAAASGELIGFVDADGATPPESFQALVDGIGSSGVIIASRWMPGAVVEPRQPFNRRLASRVFNVLVRLLFRLRITDTQCGAKLLRREAVRAVLPKLGVTRWAFDVDLLFQARRAGFSIAECPTVWRDIAGSRLKIARASMEMLIAIVRLRLVYSRMRWIVMLYDGTLGRVIPLKP